MQYNRKVSGILEDLPNKHIDTGLGLERLCMVLQGVTSNYDTDLFTPIIQEIESLTGYNYEGKSSKTDIAMRVVSDHVRAVSFSIADGKLPSNYWCWVCYKKNFKKSCKVWILFPRNENTFYL